jgi:threonine aldolase
VHDLIEPSARPGGGRAPYAVGRWVSERDRPDRLVIAVEANEIFLKVTPEEAAALRAQGFDFYDWGPGEARLVTSWDSNEAQVEALASAIEALDSTGR